MYPILFKLGPLTIYTYGLFVFLGVLAGYFVAAVQAKKEGIDSNIFSNITFWAIIWAFLGAKLLYLIVEWEYFLKNPLSVIRSGFVFYGGIISSIIAVLVLTKKYYLDFWQFSDIASIGIPLGHSLGRIGCFFYGCCYGKPTNSWIGILFPPDSPAGLLRTKVIPTQLISAGFLILFFFILLQVKQRKRFDGQVFISYLFIYGIFRFVIEFFRGDPRGQIFFLSTSQFISLIAIIVSIILWKVRKRAA